jgi:hypothetical protein
LAACTDSRLFRVIRRSLAFALYVAAMGALAGDDEPTTREFEPLMVTPEGDYFLEGDLKLKLLLEETPCLGCSAAPLEDGIGKQIGDYLLYQITPLTPQLKDYDPPPGPIDLSPEEVSKLKAGRPATKEVP